MNSFRKYFVILLVPILLSGCGIFRNVDKQKIESKHQTSERKTSNSERDRIISDKSYIKETKTIQGTASSQRPFALEKKLFLV